MTGGWFSGTLANAAAAAAVCGLALLSRTHAAPLGKGAADRRVRGGDTRERAKRDEGVHHAQDSEGGVGRRGRREVGHTSRRLADTGWLRDRLVLAVVDTAKVEKTTG